MTQSECAPGAHGVSAHALSFLGEAAEAGEGQARMGPSCPLARGCSVQRFEFKFKVWDNCPAIKSITHYWVILRLVFFSSFLIILCHFLRVCNNYSGLVRTLRLSTLCGLRS